MPATVEKILGKPIAIVTYYGHVTAEDTRGVFAQVSGLLDTYGAPIYRVTQVNTDLVDMTFDEVMLMTVLASKGTHGSTTDPNVKTVLVGDHPFIDLYADAMRQEVFGGVDIPIYDTLDEALRMVKEMIQSDIAGSGV